MVKWVDMCCGSVIPMGTLVGYLHPHTPRVGRGCTLL